MDRDRGGCGGITTLVSVIGPIWSLFSQRSAHNLHTECTDMIHTGYYSAITARLRGGVVYTYDTAGCLYVLARTSITRGKV